MKQIILFVLCLFIYGTCLAQSQDPSTARSHGMGGTGLNFEDINSAFTNQAGLANLETWSGILSAESRFARSPINGFAAAAALPVDFGVFALSLHHYGLEDFNKQKIALAYARKLVDGLSIGGQFDFYNVNVAEFGSKALVTFELGMQANITRELQLGVHLFSPGDMEFNENLALPTIYSAGLAYSPSNKTLLNLEVEKDITQATRVRTGIEYRFIDSFFMRIGAATQPTLVTLGIGVRTPSGLSIDVSSSYHQFLGISPSIGIQYIPKK